MISSESFPNFDMDIVQESKEMVNEQIRERKNGPVNLYLMEDNFFYLVLNTKPFLISVLKNSFAVAQIA